MCAAENLIKCSKCLLPASYPNADIDHSSLCSYCRNYKPFTPKGEDKLREKLTSHNGEKYDVVVPLSGGKDSTYILWYAHKVLKLRTIALNYDSGLQSELSKENIRNACEILKVPLIVKTVNYKRQTAMLRSILRIGEAVNGYFHVCGNCETGIRTSAVSVALEYNVPFILHGDDPFSVASGAPSFIGSRVFLSKLLKNKKAIPRVIYHLANYLIRSVLQQHEMGLSLRQCFKHLLSPITWPEDKVEVVHFYQYVPWKPSESINTIKTEVGWKAPEGKDSRFDCRVHCFQNHHWAREVKISHDGFMRAAQLRWGIGDKEKAIIDEEYTQTHMEEECKQMIEELGIKNYRMPG